MMTDEQIIKAFECCNNDSCENCPNLSTCCEIDITNEILNIINRQKAEIERLGNKVFVLENDLDKAESLNEALGNDVDIKLNHIYDLEEKLTKAKSEAYKEFADMLRGEALYDEDFMEFILYKDDIDTTLNKLIKSPETDTSVSLVDGHIEAEKGR